MVKEFFYMASGILPLAQHCMQFAVTARKGVERVTDYLLQQHHKLSEPF
jgi:hypothetical protein